MIYSDDKSRVQKFIFLCRLFVIYSFTTYLMKQEEKPIPSDKEKKQIAARDFIKMKRMKMKQEKTNESSFVKIRQLIIDGADKDFSIELQKQKPEIIMNFILSQNQYKEIPFYDVIRAKNLNLLKVLTEWSAKNREFIVKQIQGESSEIKEKDWENRFLVINKFVAEYFATPQNESQRNSQKLNVLGSKSSLFYILAQRFLTFQNVIATTNSIKLPLQSLVKVYCHLYEDSDLSDNKKLASSIKFYYSLLKSESIWKNLDRINVLKQLKESQIDLLKLNELGYTFWHEFAVNSSKLFLEFCQLIEEQAEETAFSGKWEDLLLQFDNSGQLPIDKCLHFWNFKDIYVLMNNYKDIKNIILSTSCLNHLLTNKKLSQQEKETLMQECLQGKLAQKGYVQAIRQVKVVNKGKIEVVNTNRYEYAIVFDKTLVKMQKDTADNYPLLTYLKIYKQKSSLRCINELWFSALDKKNIKKKYLLILNTLTTPQLQIELDTDYHKQIEVLFQYYQPLWKQFVFLPQGEILEHFVNKCYLNIFQMKYSVNKITSKASVHFFGDHFLAVYIQKSQCLDKNSITESVLAQILECKEKQKNINQFKLFEHLIVSFSNLDISQTQKTYTVQTLRSYFNSYFEIGMSREDLFKRRPMLNNNTLVYYICRYLVGRYKKTTPFFKLQVVLNKLNVDKMKQLIKIDQVYDEQFDELSAKDIYRSILTQIGQPYEQNVARDEGEYGQNAGWNSERKRFMSSYILGLPKYGNLRTQFQEHQLISFEELEAHLKTATELLKQPKNRYGYVLIKAKKQLYLEEKIKMCFVNGFDVYFNRYSKQIPDLESVLDDRTKKIVTKMHNQKCSFINAFLTSAELSIQFIEDIASSSKQQLKKLLFDRMLRKLEINERKEQTFNKLQIRFVSSSKDLYNLQLIIDLIHFANKYEQKRSKIEHEEYFLVDTVKLFFDDNADSLLNGITTAESQLKLNPKKKEEIGLEIKRRQQIFEDYVLEWLSKLSKLGRDEIQIKSVFDYIILPFLNRKKVLLHCNKFIETIELRQFFTHQLSIKKIITTPNIEQEFMRVFDDIDSQTFKKWEDLYFYTPHKNQLLKALSKFSYQSLLKINERLIYNYEQYHKKPQQQKVQPKIHLIMSLNLKFIRDIHKLVPIDHQLQSFLMIRESELLCKQFSAFLRTMIMSTHHWGNTTAALIILNPGEQFVFYMKQNGKVTGYTTYNFYNKASQEHFTTYLANLAKYNKYCPNLTKHLQIVSNALIETENWSRLLKLIDIDSVQRQLVSLLFGKLYNTTNLQMIKAEAQFQNIVQKLFDLYGKCGIQWTEHIFEAAFYFDYEKAMKVLTPELLSLKTIRNCILKHPQASRIFLKSKLKVNDANNPEVNVIKRWFPCLPHYVHSLKSISWLVQELRFQNVVLSSISQQNLMKRTNKCWLEDLSVVPYSKELFEQSQYPSNVCKAVFSNRSIVSFQPFVQMIAEIQKSLKVYLKGGSFGRKKALKCVNLQNTNPKLIQQLIRLKYFTLDEPMFEQSIFLRLLQTSNLQLLKLFLSQYKISLNQTFLQQIDKLGFTFWDHLLSISNQKFIIQVISEFNLFEMFPIQMYSPILLTSICRNRLNLLFEYVIKWITNKFKVKPVFAAAVQNDPPHIQFTTTGVFYMPVQVAMDFSYYQCYFLIRSCHNECPKFRLSSRFISKQDPNDWSFIPEMRRRVEINNSLIETLRQAQTQQFRYNILLPMIFQLEIKDFQVASTKSYLSSLLKLLQHVIDRKGQLQEAGVFQKLTLLLLNKAKTKIPDEQIERKYPSEMNLMKKLERYVKEIQIDCQLHSLIVKCEEFKPLLLMYNPEAFFQHRTFVEEMIGLSPSTNDYIEFLLGIQVNLVFIEQNHPQDLNSYMLRNFFKTGMSIYQPTASLHLKRQVFLLLLLDIWYHDRNWHESMLYNTICDQKVDQPLQHEVFLYFIAQQLNTRGASNSFDLMVWNKMLIELQNIAQMQKKLKVPSFYEHKFNQVNLNEIITNYALILYRKLLEQDIQVEPKKLETIFSQLYNKQLKYRNQGLFVEFTFLMNVCYLQYELKVLKSKVQQLFDLKNSDILNNRLQELKIQNSRTVSDLVVLLQFDGKSFFEQIRTEIYFIRLQKQNNVPKLDDFFESKDRHQFFKHYKSAINVHSFRNIQNIDLLQKIFDYGPFQTSGLIFKVIQDVQKLQQKLAGNRNIKLYNLSDVYGPINFTEANADKIFDCLGFYELLQMPKSRSIQILFCEKVPSKEHNNQRMLQHIQQYLKYYIQNAKEDQQAKDLPIDNQILIYIQENKNKQAKIEISWVGFAPWSIAQVSGSLLSYCSQISRKIQKVLDVRISYSSIIDYYSYAMKYDQQKSLKQSIQELVNAKNFVGLIESLMLMITEDVRNIMKLVKGIIIKFQMNNSKSKTRIRLLQNCCAAEVDYQVKQNLLYVVIQLQLGKSIESENDDYMKLVSRKKFLDSVFQSSQFLTDYFLIRRTLDNLCLQLSTEITKKLNTVIHFHIQYSNLYIFVDELRSLTSIKQIEGFLSRLKHYLQTNIDKAVNQYLASPELANKHQICLIDKCEAIHRDLSLTQVSAARYLVYDSIQTENKSGLTQIPKLMADIGHDQSIKNTFLLQIYKSYYSSLVTEGMTFVVGYQSSKKKSEVISIKKAQNVNQINVVQLDFILVVSKSIPTNDQLNNSKIIRIFVTDSNWNLYRVSQNIRASLLALPSGHQQRNIAEFAPIIPPNLKLVFTSERSVEEDTKDTKIFYLDLGKPQTFGEGKFKLKPVQDKPPTATQNLKKSPEFKQSINKLKAGLCAFTKSNISIIIDPPSEVNQITVNTHFDHIVSLVVSDLLEMLSRFEYQPMRNEDLDCKLSVEKKIPINQNSIVELRKRLFVKHYKTLRIKISQKDSAVLFEGSEIVINICYSKLKVLPSSTEYLSSILQNLIHRERLSLPASVLLQSKLDNQSSDVLLKLLDLINIIHYQVEEIELGKELAQLLYNVRISKYEIVFYDRKAVISYDQLLRLSFNLQSVEREFYPAEAIVRQISLKLYPGDAQSQKLFAWYLRQTNQIEVTQPTATGYRLIALTNNKWGEVPVNPIRQQNKSLIKLQFEHTPSTKFFLVDSQHSIVCNYFFAISEDSRPIKVKNYEGIIGKPNEIYLECSKKINFNTTTLSITKKDPYNKEALSNFNVRRPQIRNVLEIFLISSNIFKFIIQSQETAYLTVHHSGHPNLFAKEIDSTSITITSDGEMNLDSTKFLMLEPYKKKAVIIKDKQNLLANSDFRQPSEQASKELFQINKQDAKNIQNLVYVINDECKRFLTRAGEPRVDYIQFCDASGNPINYQKHFEVFFLHINKLALIWPEPIKRGMEVGLRWTPTVRGHYYIYINNIRMNPPYEIGVCASQADCANTNVVAPKMSKICFCEESQIMLDLRDCYGNIYSQLQQEILGDELLIQFETDKLGAFLKVNKSQINKYGLKKVKFHFNHTQGHENTGVGMKVLLNREVILYFRLDVEGYSLEQRKKLLDKDISSKDKKYYKELVVNRNKFLEDLITHAEKSLHASLTIRYVNEPGIDAGGVKREFYDMVGNEMKNEKNPFFREVNKSRMEYFFNPQILKNKKKLQYMQVWGKYLANSFLNGYLIGISFSPVFVQMLYGQTLTYEDLLEVVPQDEKRQYLYLLSAWPDEFEDLGLFFTTVFDKKRAIEVQLKEGGKSIPVTAENVKEYLHLLTTELLNNRYKQLIQAFKEGFQTVLQLTIISKWIRPSQFWCLTAGTKEITPEIVMDYIHFQGPGNIENISGWFRRYINEAPLDILTGFLKFSSGSSSIDFSRSSKITVSFQNQGQNPKKLPISHTCWKEIVIPKYKNFDIMKKLLNAAFIYCSEGFGFG